MRILVVIIALIIAIPTLAQDNVGTLKGDDPTPIINLLSDCSGTWEFFAMTDDAVGNEASAKQMRERRNGAAIAAQYLLALEYEERTGQKKTLGEFENYVIARSEPVKTALMAFFEREEFDLIKVEFEKCNAALEIQDMLIQTLRDMAFRR